MEEESEEQDVCVSKLSPFSPLFHASVFCDDISHTHSLCNISSLLITHSPPSHSLTTHSFSSIFFLCWCLYVVAVFSYFQVLGYPDLPIFILSALLILFKAFPQIKYCQYGISMYLLSLKALNCTALEASCHCWKYPSKLAFQY